MLMLLGFAAEAREPVVVAAHLLGPDFHHRLRHGGGPAQRRQLGSGFIGRPGVEVACPAKRVFPPC